jgi:hypothetical protein
MKKINITLAIVFITTLSFAQSKKYVKSMQTTMEQLYSADTVTDFDPVINKFSRIAQVEKTEWEPYYYLALAHTFKATSTKDLQAKDQSLDLALEALNQADYLSENNTELIALEGFVNMIKISVDPMTRGQALSPGIMTSFSKALKMDPNNPRANLFMAQMQIGTARFFGTSIERPCLLIEKAIPLFDQEKAQPSLAPTWGKPSALNYSAQCQSATTKAGE